MKLRNKLTLGVAAAIVALTAGVFALYWKVDYQFAKPNERGFFAVYMDEPYQGISITWNGGYQDVIYEGDNPHRFIIDHERPSPQLEVWGQHTNFSYPDG